MKNIIMWAIVLGGLGYGGAKLYLHSEVGDAMDTLVLMSSPYAKVQYDGVSSTLSGELTVDGVKVRINGFRDEITIDRIGIDTPSFLSLLQISDFANLQSKGLPKYFGFIIENLRMPVNADYYQELYKLNIKSRKVTDADEVGVACTGKYGFSPEVLKSLGYHEQVVSMSIIVRDGRTKFLVDMKASIDNMWDMVADVALAGNIKTEMLKGRQYRPRLNDLRLTYTDRSLNERVAKYCEKRGLSAAEILKAQMDSFKYVGESNGIEFDEYLLEPYAEFLGGKSTLVVTAQPNEPIAFSQIDLYKPTDVPALLNLQASAE